MTNVQRDNKDFSQNCLSFDSEIRNSKLEPCMLLLTDIP